MNPLLEIPAEFRTSKQKPNIQAENLESFQRIRNLAADNPLRKSIGDRGFSHSRVSDMKRIVFCPPAKHLNRPVKLLISADKLIKNSFLRAVRQIHRKTRQRILPVARIILRLGDSSHRIYGKIIFLGRLRPFNLGNSVNKMISVNSGSMHIIGAEILLLVEHTDKNISYIKNII